MNSTKKLLNVKQFGPFNPKPTIGSLPKVHRIPPSKLNLQHHPRYKYPCQTLMRSIDVENRFRMDFDDRSELFFGKDCVAVGSIILVDQIQSRDGNQVKSFAGVYLGKNNKGLMSSIVVRSLVMGVGVEQRIPIYSPMVSRFVVLKESRFEKVENVYFLRKEKSDLVDFEEIENLMIKFKNQESRGLLQK
jgi:ribosomal protein L19